MHRPKRIKVTDVNPHLICVLCGGYYIDATTIIECLHSFCRSCIVKYLEKNKYCPICDVQIHKHTPLSNIRNDRTLQTIVYKLVPSLYENEMRRRREFWTGASEKDIQRVDSEGRGLPPESSPIILPEEQVSLCLEYKPPKVNHVIASPLGKRYLHCPAAVTISTLSKLLRGKYSLTQDHSVQIYFKDDLLPATLSLMDLAYTYQWRRKGFISLNYRILELRRKGPSVNPKAEWKEVALKISENGVMSVVGIGGNTAPESRLESPAVVASALRNSDHSLQPGASLPEKHLNPEQKTATAESSPKVAANGEQKGPSQQGSVKTKEGVPQNSKKIEDAVSSLVRNSELEVVALDKMEANKQRISQAKGEALNRIVSRLSPNERLIGNTSVSIRAVPCESRSPTRAKVSTPAPVATTSSPTPPAAAASTAQPSVLSLLKEGEKGTVVVGNVTVSKESPSPKRRDTVPRVSVSLAKEPDQPPAPVQQLPPSPKRLPVPHLPKQPKVQSFKYKTLKFPSKTWNPTLDKMTMLSMKQSEPKPPPKFFKARSSANPLFLDSMGADGKPHLTSRDKAPPPYTPKRVPFLPHPAQYAPMLFPFHQPDLLRSMFPPGLLLPSLPPPPKPFPPDRTINNNIPPALPAPPPAAPKPPPATPKPAVIS